MEKEHILILLLSLAFFTGCMTNPSENTTPNKDIVVETPLIEKPKVDSAAIKATQDSLQAIVMLEKNKREKEVRDSIREVKRKIDKENRKKATIVTTKPKPVKPKPKPKGGAKIAFEKTVHNFGTINEGDRIKHEFFFKNTGTKDLVIKDVLTTCGCAAPGFSFFPIEPGQESAIIVNYNSKHKAGAQRSEITVITNSNPSKIKLLMEGAVVKTATK